MADTPQPTSFKNLNPGLQGRVEQAMAAIDRLVGVRPGWNVAGTAFATARQIGHDTASKLTKPKIGNLTDYTCVYSAIRDEVMRVMIDINDPSSLDPQRIKQSYSNYNQFYETGGNKDTQETIGGMKNNPDEILGLSETTISELAPEAVKTVTQAAADAAYDASHKHGFRIDELLETQQAQTETASAGMTAGGSH